MFRSFIYIDRQKFYEYKQIVDNSAIVLKQTKETKRRGFGISKGPIAIDASTQEEITSEHLNQFGYDYDVFEKKLKELEGENYFDFVDSKEKYDLKTLSSLSLIRLQGLLTIPSEFDMYDLIRQYKHLFLGELTIEDKNAEIALQILGNMKADIPIIIDSGDIPVFSKLVASNLLEELEQLEEYEQEEVFILCKVIGLKHSEEITIYDPTKDFIRLNREMRRTIKFDNDTIKPITAPGPALKVEIVAIYK